MLHWTDEQNSRVYILSRMKNYVYTDNTGNTIKNSALTVLNFTLGILHYKLVNDLNLM